MNITWLTDMDIIGSGYKNLSTPLCNGLVKYGHKVTVLGLGYKGQEHDYPFSIIPCRNMQEAQAMLTNFNTLKLMDVLIVAMDIYIHDMFLRSLPQQHTYKYVGIFPVEADPLCMTWAMILAMMDKQLVISEFGTEEAHKVGIMDAEHLPVGIDTKAWRMPTAEERKSIRSSLLGIEDDTFIVLTVADNQERKNLASALEAFRDFSKDKKAIYVLVTRENNLVGWRLRDLAAEYGISNKLMIYERGMPFDMLWSLYAAADVFVLSSKAEGLGLPLLEAMAVGIPCVATDCTGMQELLSDGRGYLIPPEYIHRDPFGNGRRYWISKECLIGALNDIYSKQILPDTKAAREYVEGRVWEDSVLQLDTIIRKLHGEK